jgi:hypothetical protein
MTKLKVYFKVFYTNVCPERAVGTTTNRSTNGTNSVRRKSVIQDCPDTVIRDFESFSSLLRGKIKI